MEDTPVEQPIPEAMLQVQEGFSNESHGNSPGISPKLLATIRQTMKEEILNLCQLGDLASQFDISVSS